MKIFGNENVANNYIYESIIKGKENDQNPRYIKLNIKFNTDSNSKPTTINTKVFIKTDRSENEEVSGIVTLDDINKYIRHNSTNRFVIELYIYARINSIG